MQFTNANEAKQYVLNLFPRASAKVVGELHEIRGIQGVSFTGANEAYAWLAAARDLADPLGHFMTRKADPCGCLVAGGQKIERVKASELNWGHLIVIQEEDGDLHAYGIRSIQRQNGTVSLHLGGAIRSDYITTNEAHIQGIEEGYAWMVRSDDALVDVLA